MINSNDMQIDSSRYYMLAFALVILAGVYLSLQSGFMSASDGTPVEVADFQVPEFKMPNLISTASNVGSAVETFNAMDQASTASATGTGDGDSLESQIANVNAMLTGNGNQGQPADPQQPQEAQPVAAVAQAQAEPPRYFDASRLVINVSASDGIAWLGVSGWETKEDEFNNVAAHSWVNCQWMKDGNFVGPDGQARWASEFTAQWGAWQAKCNEYFAQAGVDRNAITLFIPQDQTRWAGNPAMGWFYCGWIETGQWYGPAELANWANANQAKWGELSTVCRAT